MIDIELTWKGPVDFHRICEPEYKKQLDCIEKPGIYLHCNLINTCKYAITYVGMADDSIYDRNIRHLSNSKKGDVTLIDVITFDIIYRAQKLKKTEFLEQYSEKLKENNETDKFFYAHYDPTKFIKAFNFDKKKNGFKLQPLEGAIQWHLFKKTESRKYLLTKVSNYDLIQHKKYKYNIKNDFRYLQNIQLVGLDAEIKYDE